MPLTPTSPLRRTVLAATLALLVAPAAHAVSQNQSWSADWLVIQSVDDQTIEIPGSASGNGAGGTVTVDATLPKGSWVGGSMTLDFDPAAGSLRSRTDVDAFIDQSSGPVSQSYDNFHFESSNRLSFTDMLSVGAGGFGTLAVTVKVNGQISHNAQIDSPPFAFSFVDLRNELTVNASLEGGGSGSTGDMIESEMKGIVDDRFSISDVARIDDQFALVVPWTSGTPLAFSFSYDETMQFDMQYLDGESVSFSGINAFGHTLELFASVYDGSGMLMEGVSVTSSLGIGYAPLPAVPEPSSLLLMAGGVAGLLAWRRRPASASA